MVRIYGEANAKKIMARMQVLAVAPSLDAVPTYPPDRCHELKGNRRGQFAVDLVQRRLVFRPDHSPVPMKGGGSVDKSRVTAIEILSVEDYH